MDLKSYNDNIRFLCMKAKILIVEDEPDTIELLTFNLRSAGYQTDSATSGKEAVARIQKSMPDLILLDILMPDLNGFEVCKMIRAEPRLTHIPIIMLTACNSEIDRVLGLEIGANDYITKPFSTRELVLRIENQLQKVPMKEIPLGILRCGPIILDIPKHVVFLDGVYLDLTKTEFKLLSILIKNKDRVLSREQLLQEVWGYDAGSLYTRTVDTHIRRLRAKLNRAASLITSVHGVGYRWVG